MPARRRRKRVARGLPFLLLTGCRFDNCAQGCTIVELNGGGFVSNILNLLHALPIFHQTNGTLYIDSTQLRYTCSPGVGWSDFFKGDEKLVPWSPAKEAASGERCQRVTAADVDEIMFNKVHQQPQMLEYIGVERHWSYLPWVEALLRDKVFPTLRVARPSIGFHLRGGSKATADRISGRKFLQAQDYLDAFLTGYPQVQGGTCLVTGDDNAMADELAKLAAAQLGCKPYRTRPYANPGGYNETWLAALPIVDRCEATIEILADLEILAHTDFFVSTYASAWSRVVHALRVRLYGKQEATSLDASAAQGDLYSKIRRFLWGGNGTHAHLPQDLKWALRQTDAMPPPAPLGPPVPLRTGKKKLPKDWGGLAELVDDVLPRPPAKPTSGGPGKGVGKRKGSKGPDQGGSTNVPGTVPSITQPQGAEEGFEELLGSDLKGRASPEPRPAAEVRSEGIPEGQQEVESTVVQDDSSGDEALPQHHSSQQPENLEVWRGGGGETGPPENPKGPGKRPKGLPPRGKSTRGIGESRAVETRRAAAKRERAERRNEAIL